MASAFGHAFVGYTVARSGAPNPRWLLVALPLCSVLPDVDVLAFRFGIPYAHPIGHRGLTHSLLFAAVVAVAGTLVLGQGARGRVFTLFFMATASHGLLDAMTTGGLGVGFFLPFSTTRYFLPWRPVRVSPVSVDHFFTGRGWAILRSEALWIGVPCVALLAVRRLWTPQGASRTR